ncbi:glycosyltransferase family 4 protein [Luteolibacter flavescens]|nr:glycosyltransferase family 4 protein [Luteolibacter flavescens]
MHFGSNDSNTRKIRKLVVLGNYVPKRCGIATFTEDLYQAVTSADPLLDCSVIAMGDRSDYPPEVALTIDPSDTSAYQRAADYVREVGADALCVQHEFGIYGGAAGSYLMPLLRHVKVPVITTLHSILRTPDIAQRKVMDELVQRSSRLVVMAEKGAEILSDVYGVDRAMIDVIPHGVPDFQWSESDPSKKELGYTGKKVLLTFGLLGPGKGIEFAIRSMPAIAKRHPEALYVVLGATHPNLVAHEGERYRESLQQLADDLGVTSHVHFENRFVDMLTLKRYIAAADIYLTPYPNQAQITSGTLAYAFGAGKAVISTPYWHAQELLSRGGGLLVEPRDAGAISTAVNRLLDDPVEMDLLRRTAFKQGREMTWTRVGELYLDSFGNAAAGTPLDHPAPSIRRLEDLPPLKLDHLERLTDRTGLFQHATFDIPNYHEGYCTDDNARAFILTVQLESAAAQPALRLMASTYLAFLASAFNQGNGRFRNFMSHSRQWLEEAGSEDSHGRALWAVGRGAAGSRRDGWRLLCIDLFQRGLPVVEHFSSPRAWAFALLGMQEYLSAYPSDLGVHRLRGIMVERLLKCWQECAGDEWNWFEDVLTYDNARIPQALILAGSELPESGALEAGLASLEWLMKVQTADFGHFRPIGNNGFYSRDGDRADFDQQPLEAQATVAACLSAWQVTGESSWLDAAKRAFEWFLGRNDVGLPLHDADTGGCCDGLQPDRVNANQGAESSLAFSLSLAELRDAMAAKTETVKQIA